MKKAILTGYLLLFFKFNLTINDMGYIYLLTNIFGSSILFLEFKKTEKNTFTHFTLGYLLLNVFLFILSMLDFNLMSLGMTNSFSFAASLFILFLLFYNFLYPLFSFSYIVGNIIRESPHFSRVTTLTKIALFFATLSLVSFFVSPAFASLSILAVIIMEISLIPLLTHGFQQQYKEEQKLR